MDSLTSAVWADDYGTRIRAALVIESLASPGETLKRRVETISLVASNINERTTEVDLNLAAALAVAKRVDIDLNCAILSFCPKALMSGFSVRASDGSIKSSERRKTDSRMAQCLLIGLALSREDGLPGLTMPSQAVWTLVYEHCFRFAVEFNPYEGLAHALTIGSKLQGDDRDWWIRACASEVWLSWLLKLGDLFMVVTQVDSTTPGLQHFSFTRRSGRDRVPNPGVARELLRAAKPEHPLAIRLYDLGHAESEHVHLSAAEGTFLSGGFLAQRHSGVYISTPPLSGHQGTIEFLKYRRRPSRHELLLNVEQASLGNCLLLANMWPETRGFVTPVRYISYWVSLLAVLAAVTTLFTPLDDLRQSADATFMVLYLLPSLALGYLIQPDIQPDIRWRMLRWSRTYAAVLMAVSIALSILWLFDPQGWAKWVVFGLDLAGAIVAILVAVRTNSVTRHIIKASNLAKTAEETGPPRGYPATVKVTRR